MTAAAAPFPSSDATPVHSETLHSTSGDSHQPATPQHKKIKEKKPNAEIHPREAKPCAQKPSRLPAPRYFSCGKCAGCAPRAVHSSSPPDKRGSRSLCQLVGMLPMCALAEPSRAEPSRAELSASEVSRREAQLVLHTLSLTLFHKAFR